MKRLLFLFSLCFLPFCSATQQKRLIQCIGTMSLLATKVYTLPTIKDKDNAIRNVQLVDKLRNNINVEIGVSTLDTKMHEDNTVLAPESCTYKDSTYDIGNVDLYGWSLSVNQLDEKELYSFMLDYYQKNCGLASHFPYEVKSLIYQFSKKDNWTIHGFNRKTGTRYDIMGWNEEATEHCDTGTKYNLEGWNREGTKHKSTAFISDTWNDSRKSCSDDELSIVDRQNKNTVSDGEEYDVVTGWNKDFTKHRDTGTEYDLEGYSWDGTQRRSTRFEIHRLGEYDEDVAL